MHRKARRIARAAAARPGPGRPCDRRPSKLVQRDAGWPMGKAGGCPSSPAPRRTRAGRDVVRGARLRGGATSRPPFRPPARPTLRARRRPPSAGRSRRSRRAQSSSSDPTTIRLARSWVNPAHVQSSIALVRSSPVESSAEVNGAPGQERDLPLHRPPLGELDHGSAAADRRHRPLVVVGERLGRFRRRAARAMFSPARSPACSATDPSCGRTLAVSRRQRSRRCRRRRRPPGGPRR